MKIYVLRHWIGGGDEYERGELSEPLAAVVIKEGKAPDEERVAKFLGGKYDEATDCIVVPPTNLKPHGETESGYPVMLYAKEALRVATIQHDDPQPIMFRIDQVPVLVVSPKLSS